jgi:hypothetical protein
VPRGSYLVIESLDRLSREHIQPALLLALNLLQDGIRIVQLSPVEVVFDDRSEAMQVMMMVMELSRGHSESAIKSHRVGKVWKEKKRRVRTGEFQEPTARMGKDCKVLTRWLPAWVEERGGERHPIPARAAVVKHIFELAAGGYGYGKIVHRLDAEGGPPFGEYVVRPGRKRSACSGKWTRAYIARILKDRRATGEYQPMTGRKPDGDPVPDYFPQVVTQEEWLAARAGASQRKRRSGRPGSSVNVFSGMLRDALTGGTYCGTSRLSRGVMRKLLVTTASTQAQGACRSFPLPVFEAAVLSRLREIDPHEILNGDQRPDETLVLSGELARVDARIAELEAELERGDVAALARMLRRLEEQKGNLVKQLDAAREKAANQLSESWGEAQSLAEALNTAPDPQDARLRFRSALRRIADSMWLLVVPRNRDRLAAVQIWFAGAKRRRDYLIVNRATRSNGNATVPGGWSVRSFATEAAGLDLWKPDHAKRLEKALLAVQL